MHSKSSYPSKINSELTAVLRRAKKFSKQQNWGERKSNIYTAMISYLAGTGYFSGLNLHLVGWNIFKQIIDYIQQKIPKGWAHGRMSYDEAQILITSCPEFQDINC